MIADGTARIVATFFIPPPWRWLLIEGLLPLAGASILYLLFGGCRYVAHNRSSGGPFTHVWMEALDPFGWLYGAAVISTQSALLSATAEDAVILTVFCWVCALVCVLLLLAAMTERGSASVSRPWRPSLVFQGLVIFLVVAILYAGFRAHSLHGTGDTK